MPPPPVASIIGGRHSPADPSRPSGQSLAYQSSRCRTGSRTRSRIGDLHVPRGQSGRFQFIVEFFESDQWKEVAWFPLYMVVQQQQVDDLSMSTSPS